MAIQTSMDRRSAAYTVSRRSSVMVVGGFASGKWFVSLTGEVPTRPLRLCRENGTHSGKPTYKSTTKAEATREEWKLREQEVPSIPMTFLR
jgi:hypothetical protein